MRNYADARVGVVMKQPTETAIFNAVEYALRHEPVTEIDFDEGGEFEIEIIDPHSLVPFATCLLRELEVIP